MCCVGALVRANASCMCEFAVVARVSLRSRLRSAAVVVREFYKPTALTSTAHHPHKLPTQQTQDYRESLTPSFALQLCLFHGSLLLQIYLNTGLKNAQFLDC